LECQEQLACKWQRRMLGQHLPNCPSNGHPSIECPSNERLSNMNIPDLTFLPDNHHDSLSPFGNFIFHSQLPLYIHIMFLVIVIVHEILWFCPLTLDILCCTQKGIQWQYWLDLVLTTNLKCRFLKTLYMLQPFPTSTVHKALLFNFL
jgi:hypothetical protein